MILNPALAVIFLLLVGLNLISLYYLKKLEIKPYFMDTALVSGTMIVLAAAYYFGQPALLLGIFLYGFRLTDSSNVLKFLVLYAGLPLGFFTSNNFYTYSSVILLFLYSIVRLVESIIEMSLWTPEQEESPIEDSMPNPLQ